MISPRKALFIQLRRIGDILMCTPSIRAFKKRYPDCQLDFLTEYPDVLQGNPHIGSVIAVDQTYKFNFAYQFGLIRKIRTARYDLIVDFLSSPRSAYYAYLSGARTRLSYGIGHRRWAYNLVPQKSDEPVYSALDKLRLLEAIDIPHDGLKLEFYPSDKDREIATSLLKSVEGRPLVTLSPVSRRAYRRWPLENFARLAELLETKLGANIIVIVGPGESEAANKVAKLSKAKVEVQQIEKLGVLGALFERVSLHIGNDNGPKHIAVACGAPTISIYGPNSPVSWTYPEPSRHDYVCPVELCNDCQRKKHRCDPECIKSISVESVWLKAVKMASTLPSFSSLSRKP